MKTAIGLIETKGLVAAVAAADKALKSAKVILEGKEITEPGYVTIRFTGELNEIQIAVAAGTEAARDAGELVSSIVISDPDSQLSVLLKNNNEKAFPAKEIFTFPAPFLKEEDAGDFKIVKPVKEKVPKPVSSSSEKTVQNQVKKSLPDKKKFTIPTPALSEADDGIEVNRAEPPKKKLVTASPLKAERRGEIDTITRLRMEALGKNIESNTEAPVIKENKEEDLSVLNVHQLRKLARSTPDFPIFGRKISKANRDELLKLFNGIGR